MYQATIYYTVLYWRNVPMVSKKYKYKKALLNWIDKQVVKINNNGNCSFKNCKSIEIKDI